MRALILAILALMTASAWAGRPEIHPCAAEIDRLQSSQDQITATTTQIVEWRSKTASEQTYRMDVLSSRLQEANSALDAANQSALQDTRLLERLSNNRATFEAWITAPPAALDRALTAILVQQRDLAFSASVRLAVENSAEASAMKLLELARTVESSREWNSQVKDIRQLAEAGEPVLATISLRVLALMESTQANLAQHPKRMAQLKQRVSEAQAALDASSQRQAEFEQKRTALERRLDLLRTNLPGQKSSLNACMHRAQFGN